LEYVSQKKYNEYDDNEYDNVVADFEDDPSELDLKEIKRIENNHHYYSFFRKNVEKWEIVV